MRAVQQVLDALPTAAFLVAPGGWIQQTNAIGAEMLGYERGELIQKPLQQLIAGDPTPLSPILEQGAGDAIWQGELEVLAKSGRIIPVQTYLHSVTIQRESLLLAVLTDISQQQAEDRQLREALITFGHELRHPLATMRVHAELLVDEGGRHGHVGQLFLERIDHLNRLVGDLLFAARLEDGRVSLRIALCDLLAVIRNVVAQAQSQTKRHHIHLHCATPSVWVACDEGRIAQVVANLLSNAIKYSPNGGDIDVFVENGMDIVRVSVRDSGIGIPHEALGKVFSRYYRTEKAMELERGMGIGLYVCKLLVEAHGGSITAESPGPNQGSTFTFTLPRTPHTSTADRDLAGLS